jgi:CheY-like chemotaxis protein
MKARSKERTGVSDRPRELDPGVSQQEACCVHLNSDSLHDLVGPVNQMCSLADVILKKYRGTLDDEAEVLFGFIKSSASRLQNLMAGVRTYMRVVGSGGPYCRCDANALLQGALASIGQAIERDGAVVTHDPLPELYCDPNQMIYILASLIENSIKFRREPRPEIHVSAISEEHIWVFSVRDNGIGIDTRYRDRIFGMFKRIEIETNAGAGVGLAIVRQIVEQHGGKIWVESTPGLGATFHFTLPRDVLQTLGMERCLSPKAMSKGKPTILVVDADAVHRESMRRALRSQGYRVLEATDFQQAENVHGQHCGQINLLLTAISLPGGNGYELAKALLNLDTGIKVLFVSGQTGAKVSEFYDKSLIDPLTLSRPFEPADLLRRVEYLLETNAQSADAS